MQQQRHHDGWDPSATMTRAWCRSRCAGAVATLYTASILLAAASPLAAQGLPLIRDTEIEALLKDYSRPIFREAGLERQNIQMKIVNSRVFNAFVFDGGNVFIHTGALMTAETPNEVIGVIAHETGHIARADIASLQASIRRATEQQLLLALLGIGLMVGGAIAGGDTARDMGALGTATQSAGQSFVIHDLLRMRRQQESAADQAGFQYLTRAKQSGRGMLTTFERLASGNMFSIGDQFLRTHPTEAARLQQLRELVEKSPFVNKLDPPELQLRHDLMRAKLYGYTASREVAGKYPATDNSLPARYARAIVRNCAGRCARAIEDVDALIREKPTNPYFWELKGHLLVYDRKLREAEAPLREALRLLKGNAPQVQILLARTLAESNDPSLLPQAIDLAEKALIQEKEDVQIYQLLSQAYYSLQKEGEAQLMTAEVCLLRGNPARAHIFAKRAQNEFAKRPPDKQRGVEAKKTRAADIIITTAQHASGRLDGGC